MASFAMQKLLSFIKSDLFIFSFISFKRWIQKHIAAIYIKESSPNVYL